MKSSTAWVNVIAGVVLAVGLLTLVGWRFDIIALTRILPNLSSMNPTTAAAFMLSAVSLWLLRSRTEGMAAGLTVWIARVLAIIVLTAATLRFAHSFLGLDFAVDQLLFAAKVRASTPPSRMADTTATGFALLALALLTLDFRLLAALRPHQICASLIFLLALLAIIGYAYGVQSFYVSRAYVGMPIQTALCFTAIGAGLLLARPRQGLMAALSSPEIAGSVGRRFMLIALVVPPLLGWLRLSGERLGWYDTEFGVALSVLSTTAVLAIVTWFTIRHLERVDARRRHADEQLRSANVELERRVADRTTELQQSQDRLAGIVGSAMDGIISIDEDQRVVLFNAAAERMFGCVAADAIGSPIERFIPQRFRAEHAGHIRRFAETGVTSRRMGALGAISGLRSNGEEFPIEASISQVQADGRRFFTVILRDITERKRGEQALRLSQARLEGIVGSAMDAIITVDADQRIVLYNAAAERMFQHPAGQIIGQPLEVLIPPRFRGVHAEHIRRYGETGITNRRMGEMQPISGLRANGDEFPIEASISQIEAGGTKFFTVILRDITQRVRDEEALRISQARLASVVETALDAVIMIDAGGVVIGWNPQAEETFGWKTSDIIGRVLADTIIPPQYREAHRLGLARYLHTGEGPVLNRRIEIEGQDRNGRIFPVELAIVAVPSPGMPPTFSAFVRDITERKQHEQAIRALNADLERRVEHRTAQLEAANRELEAFSYTVSHDLRAPLRAMDGFSRILQEDYSGALDESSGRYLQLIRDNARQMGELIDDLLQFSRLGRQAPMLQPVNPEPIVRAVLEDLHRQQPEREVDVRIEPLPECCADPSLLRQVYVNLLSNAFKFTRDQAHPVIEVGSRPEDKSGQLAYYVRDNGVGFDMAYVDKLFGVFQRLHKAEEYEGTGVGLAIVQRIVHRHGGRVWAEAGLNKGATFYFTLGSESEHNHERTGHRRDFAGRGQPQ